MAGGLCFALAATVAPASAHATEPAAPVEYRSVFEGYRAFDAQAVLVDWRQTNAAIREGHAGAMHETPSSEAKQKDDTPTSTHDHKEAPTTDPGDSESSSEPSPPDAPKDPHAGHHE